MPNSHNIKAKRRYSVEINRLYTSLFSTDSHADGAVFDTTFQRSPDKVTIFFVTSILSMTVQHTIYRVISATRLLNDMLLLTNPKPLVSILVN